MEDAGLVRRWEEGWLNLEKLLTFSAVCGTGLDTVPVPGSTTIAELAGVISDVASLAVRLAKPLSVRVMPIAGKEAGERTTFSSPYMVNTLIKPLGPSRIGNGPVPSATATRRDHVRDP